MSSSPPQSLLIQDLAKDFTSSSASPESVKQSGNQFIAQLLFEMENCYDKKQSIHDSKKLQELVEKSASLFSLYREVSKN